MDWIKEYSYENHPVPELIASSKLETKTLIIARAGMLECGKNFKGSIPEMCKKCHVLDDENHRMKDCPDWHHPNDLEDLNLLDFKDIYSNDPQKLQPVIKHIQGVWELSLGKGTMKKRSPRSWRSIDYSRAHYRLMVSANCFLQMLSLTRMSIEYSIQIATMIDCLDLNSQSSPLYFEFSHILNIELKL